MTFNQGANKKIEEISEPLEVKWFSDSKINIPLKPWNG